MPATWIDMNSPTVLIPLLMSSAAVLAQSPLRVTDVATLPIVWQQEVDCDYAAIQYDEEPGERTLLFTHVTVDESVCGTVVAAGVIKALPFLASPSKQQWQLTAPALAAMTTHNFSGDLPYVPPRRIAQHLTIYAESSSQNDYGTFNPQTVFVTRLPSQNMVANVTLATDERSSWANSNWAYYDEISNQAFDTTRLGREAVFQAAHEFVVANSLPPIDPAGLAALSNVLDLTIGWEVFVQAAHVKPSTSGEVDVRIGRYARVRRRSFGQTGGWPYGPSRYVPDPTSPSGYIYLAPRGDFLHLEFPVEVGTLANPTSLIAYVPTTTGLVIVNQVANPTWLGDLLKPKVGIFPCPANAVDGIMFIAKAATPTQRFAPDGHYGNAALISAYDIPSGPLIPPQAPAGGGLPPQ
ncbi:MAG: hypothetical protein ACI91B_003838 [Planctomycetota bacterium]